MKPLIAFFLIALVVSLPAADAWKLPADAPRFRAGPGAEIAAVNCILCHSSDYISTQPPLERAAWLATVNKMRDKYGAPLPTNQVERVVDYLAGAYGKKAK